MSAVFSECRTFRYVLTREWDAGLPPFVVIGLNPSTADETNDDPTIRRCVGFAEREGCGRLVMVNLFAFRSTDPSILKKHPKDAIVGPENDEHLLEVTSGVCKIVCGWGNHGRLYNRDWTVTKLLLKDRTLCCLARNKDRSPKHPLYVKADKALEPFSL